MNSVHALLEWEAKAELGEGPVWDELEKKLYWVDILNGVLIQYDPLEKSARHHPVGGHLSAAALREGGGLVLAIDTGFVFYDLQTKKLEAIADPEAHLPGNRFNDGKCDPAGRFWSGTMAYSEEKGAGNLYCLHSDGRIEVKLRNVSISNGLAWNRKQNKLFYIDTPTFNIYSFDYHKETGKISNQSVIKEIEKSDGYPDGMTIDNEDHLWIALYGGNKVVRIDPENGKIVFDIHVPVPKVTSCTFGGVELNELYITTCREKMSEQELKQAPLSGSLFKAELPYQGLPAYRFSG